MVLEIPAGDFEGYIFDCDGTLAHSMPIHYQAWKTAFLDRGAKFDFTEDLFYSFAGMHARAIIGVLNERFGDTLDPVEVSNHKEHLYLDYLHTVEPLEAVVEYARRAAGLGHPVSVASGSRRSVVTKTLDAIGVLELFPIVITPEDVVHGKPAPDMFLLAADRMGIAPEKCLVFEDGEPGIVAAQAAGMACVFVPSRA